jgi:hypothetical protein
MGYTDAEFQDLLKRMPPERAAEARARADAARQEGSTAHRAALRQIAAAQTAVGQLWDEIGEHLPEADCGECVTELRFHPTRKWRFDFAWPSRLVAVEVHGAADIIPGTTKCPHCHEFKRGRHLRRDGFEADREKINEAVLLGWRVFEFSSQQVRRGEALAVLRRFFGRT